ncbi:MAG: protease modulator HflC [Planctomycetia bacterium]|nr:MAG: protease modulator HflC [Planctomycetia bacterium]
MRKVPLLPLITGGLLVLLLVVYMVRFQVRFNEVAVRVRLGQADEHSRKDEPGVYFKIPLVDAVHVYDRRLRVLDTPEIEIKTRDQKNVILGLYALWRVADPLQYSIRLQTDRTAEQQLRSRLNDVRAAVIGRYDMSAFVGLDAEAVNATYDEIETALRDIAAADIRRDYGIELVSVGIRRISLPEQVTQAVFESQKAERQTIAARYRGEGASQAQAIRSRAKSAADQIRQFAVTKAEMIASAGFESSARILAQIRPEDRDFFIWLRAMDALRIALKEKSTIFFDSAAQISRLMSQPPADGKPPRADAEMLPAGSNEGGR